MCSQSLLTLMCGSLRCMAGKVPDSCSEGCHKKGTHSHPCGCILLMINYGFLSRSMSPSSVYLERFDTLEISLADATAVSSIFVC